MGAMGQLQEAIAQFDTLLRLVKEDEDEGEDDYSDDESGSHHLIFYQREWAIYQLRNLDRDVRTFNPDREVNPYFKEFFTMRESPRTLVHELGYVPQVIPQMDKPHDVVFQPSIGHLDSSEQRRILEAQQIYFPASLQLQSPGFLSNQRQHRQAGLAILTIAQQLRKHWHKISEYTSESQPYLVMHGDGGSDSKNPVDHAYGWRDVFDVAVKWRQLVSA